MPYIFSKLLYPYTLPFSFSFSNLYTTVMSATVDFHIIKQLPPSVLRTLPAGTAPRGVQAKFVDPPTLVPAVLGVGSSFLALALFCFSIRVWTKLTIIKKCSWDDCEYHSIKSMLCHETILTFYTPVTCTLGFVSSTA